MKKKNWSIRSLTGGRAAVVSGIEANGDVPPSFKAALIDLVNAIPAEFNGAVVDAHETRVPGMVNIHITVSEKKLAG